MLHVRIAINIDTTNLEFQLIVLKSACKLMPFALTLQSDSFDRYEGVEPFTSLKEAKQMGTNMALSLIEEYRLKLEEQAVSYGTPD